MHSSSNLQPQLVDVRDAARLYGCSERSIWRLTKAGQIPAPVQVGSRATRWRLAELLAHIGQMPPAQAKPNPN